MARENLLLTTKDSNNILLTNMVTYDRLIHNLLNETPKMLISSIFGLD